MSNRLQFTLGFITGFTATSAALIGLVLYKDREFSKRTKVKGSKKNTEDRTVHYRH